MFNVCDRRRVVYMIQVNLSHRIELDYNSACLIVQTKPTTIRANNGRLSSLHLEANQIAMAVVTSRYQQSQTHFSYLI